jgi:hypothetical protein
MFVSLAAMRMLKATTLLAGHALNNVGQPAREPGPHALILLSADPHLSGTADVNAATRTFHIGEADDILTMLATMTQRLREKARTAAHLSDAGAAGGRRFDRLSHHDVGRITRALGVASFNHDTAAFPYAPALAEDLLWDPRQPVTGITGATDTVLSEATTYIGVAVITLDQPDQPWADIKGSVAKARHPMTGIPLTAAHVGGYGWALLDNNTVLQVRRLPASTDDHFSRNTSEITTNVELPPLYDSHVTMWHWRDLENAAPPLMGSGPHPAQPSRQLWAALRELHQELHAALGESWQS